jgi:hypothetical protein
MEPIKIFETRDKPQRLDYTFIYPQPTKRKFNNESINQSFIKK